MTIPGLGPLSMCAHRDQIEQEGSNGDSRAVTVDQQPRLVTADWVTSSREPSQPSCTQTRTQNAGAVVPLDALGYPSQVY